MFSQINVCENFQDLQYLMLIKSSLTVQRFIDETLQKLVYTAILSFTYDK